MASHQPNWLTYTSACTLHCADETGLLASTPQVHGILSYAPGCDAVVILHAGIAACAGAAPAASTVCLLSDRHGADDGHSCAGEAFNLRLAGGA